MNDFPFICAATGFILIVEINYHVRIFLMIFYGISKIGICHES